MAVTRMAITIVSPIASRMVPTGAATTVAVVS